MQFKHFGIIETVISGLDVVSGNQNFTIIS